MIPIIALSVYLFLALNIFREDKIAYVFDSSRQVSSTVASQVKIQMGALLTGLRPVLQDFLSHRNFTSTGKALFQSEAMTDLIVVYKKDQKSQQWAYFSHLDKTQKEFPLYEDQITGLLPRVHGDLQNRNRALFGPMKSGALVLAEKVVNEDTNETTIFLVVFQLLEIQEMFNTSGAQNLYMVDHNFRVLFGPEGSATKNLFEIVPLTLDAGSRVSQGTQKVTTEDGKDLLVSFSRTGFSDLTIVNTIDQASALSALQVLVRKSFIFFIILMSAVAMVSLLASSTLTRALSVLFDATQKVSQGNFQIRVNIKSNDEVGSLANNFNLMAAEVERLMLQTAEKARMESELQTAKTVQETLFPETRAQIGGLQVAGFYEPASECGGDWWNYSALGSKVYLWIGDATGHGAPAALITSAAKSASAIIERLDIGPAEALKLLNRCIYDVSKGRIMMTFFLGCYDSETSILTYSNASHEAPFLIKKSDSAPKRKDLISLNDIKSPRLGQGRETDYTEAQVRLDPGDTVLFYTDGIPDIRNTADEAWGEREFIKALVASQKDFPSAAESVDRLVDKFQTFRQNSGLVDDVTFFVVKKNEKEGTV